MTTLKQAHEYLRGLVELSMSFATVERAPRYRDGHRESDVEHSFHLSLSAVQLAKDFYPDLDLGLVTQFSLVHDMPEVYAGDVWTVHVTKEQLEQKAIDEATATEKLLKELPAVWADLLERYEKQEEPEARFVRFIDKILPWLITTVAPGVSTFKQDHDVQTLEHYTELRRGHMARFKKMFPEFHELYELFEMIWDSHADEIFAE